MVISKTPESTVGHEDKVAGETVSRATRQRFDIAAGALSGAATVILGIGLTTWINTDNAIAWKAEETSTVAVYPADHALYGYVLGIAFVLGLSALACVVWVLIGRRRTLTAGIKGAWVMAWFAASLSLSVYVTMRFSVYLAAPLLISAFSAAYMGLIRSTSRTRHPRP